jgi:hypothetical protein
VTDIFVFGSNLAGRHGAGAAKFARENHGAIYGKGIGHHGNSYAIPTKDHSLNTLALVSINKFVKEFLEYAKNNPSLIFKLTPIGCGLAGYSPKDIAPMFVDAPFNVKLPLEFQQVIGGS